jgi:4-hydroxy-tetrahydrodipicolinate synthase
MKMNLFDGVATALITPFTQDGAVDYEGMRRNVRFQLENDIAALVPLGTTGETPTLRESEREEVVRVVAAEVKAANKNVPIIVGVGTNSTEHTIANALDAQKWGATALLIVSPYYNKPTQEGLYRHFAAVNQVVDLPIIVYNIKGRTGVNIETPTMKRIAGLSNVVAIKEASGDINQMMDVLEQVPELAVYSGDDSMTFPLVCLGGRGIISVVSNLLPDRVVEMTTALLAGDVARGRRIHFELLPIFKGAFIETNPIPIKYAMNCKGLAAGGLRLPLVELSERSKATLDNILRTNHYL